jgi:purine-binding chemotaxis protein CheW
MHEESTRSGHSADQLQLVSFTVGDELFAVDILSVQEINRMMELTKVPQSSDGIEGVINLRGRIIPILDLRVQFGLASSGLDENSRIVVVEVRGNTVGFIVDSVHEVLRIDRSIIEPTPRMTTSIDSSYVDGVAKLEDDLLILLDLNNLLSNEALNKLSNIRRDAA